MLVASPLLVLLVLVRCCLPEDLAVIQIVFNEEDEEDSGDEGETAGAKEERDVPKVAGNVGGGEWSNLATAGE